MQHTLQVNSLMAIVLKPIFSLCEAAIFNNFGVPARLISCQFTSGLSYNLACNKNSAQAVNE